ncbi:hypothetical protein F4703DRAFT_1799294 [Phycomyces blakesleeanus]
MQIWLDWWSSSARRQCHDVSIGAYYMVAASSLRLNKNPRISHIIQIGLNTIYCADPLVKNEYAASTSQEDCLYQLPLILYMVFTVIKEDLRYNLLEFELILLKHSLTHDFTLFANRILNLWDRYSGQADV